MPTSTADFSGIQQEAENFSKAEPDFQIIV